MSWTKSRCWPGTWWHSRRGERTGSPHGQTVPERLQLGAEKIEGRHDPSAAGQDEILHLEIHRAPLIVRRQPEIAPVAEHRFSQRRPVADFGCSATLHVGTVEDRHDDIRGPNRPGVVLPDGPVDV